MAPNVCGQNSVTASRFADGITSLVTPYDPGFSDSEDTHFTLLAVWEHPAHGFAHAVCSSLIPDPRAFGASGALFQVWLS